MATVERRAGAASASSGRKEPSVLVVLVARDGSPWLRQSLRALAGQTYPRIGVLAIDNASADGSAELLESALGSARVVRSERDVGVSGALGLALATETAQQA